MSLCKELQSRLRKSSRFETSKSVSAEKSDKSDSDHPSPASEHGKLPISGHGDVMRSLQSLRERVTMLEKENEALRLSSRPKNPKKREFSDE